MVDQLNIIMGAKNNPQNKRVDNDFYATHPSALESFLKKLKEDCCELSHDIWECSCGQGHLSEVLKNWGYNVRSSDLINRGYGEIKDFLATESLEYNFDILTNPPYNLAEKFIEKGMELLGEERKLILFLKIQFLESKKRLELFKKFPPKYVYVHSERQLTSRNAEFDKYNTRSIAYIWAIWEKGFNSDTILRWI